MQHVTPTTPPQKEKAVEKAIRSFLKKTWAHHRARPYWDGCLEKQWVFITSKADIPRASRGSRDWHSYSPLSAAFVQSKKAQSQETQGLFKVSQQAFEAQPTESATQWQGAEPLSFNRQPGFCIFNRKFHFAFLTRGIMHPLYIKSISTLPILFVLFPFRWGNVFLLQCTLHSKTCTGIKLYVCLDKQIGPQVQGKRFYSFIYLFR